MAKHVTDFTKGLADLVEERCSTVQVFVDEARVAPQVELAKFVWGTSRKIHKKIDPNHDHDGKRKQAWEEAKGMLKEIIDFELWSPLDFRGPCIKTVSEKIVAEVLKNYLHFVLTGEVRTKHAPPKLLGETDELLVIDKPPMFTCNYGSGKLPPTAGCETPTQLLNCTKATIQIHEYLALKFDYECAEATKNFWREVKNDSIKEQPCQCGRCDTCATMQAGCCNRLDKETSGVMVAAKTFRGFPEIRMQFNSDHSLEVGGTEKFYFALVRGEVRVPTEKKERSPDWKVEPDESDRRRGRIEIALYFDKAKWKAFPWNDGDQWKSRDSGNRKAYTKQGEDREEGFEQGESDGRLHAITFYEPVAWFTDRLKSDEQYTLLKLQIVTGRTHQIRFHCSQIGHCLVGDCAYGAPQSDRDWAKRACLHSYKTKFMEPFSEKWYEAISPLPQDLGDLMSSLRLRRVQEGCPLFLSRRSHAPLHKMFRPYDANSQLLQRHDPPRNAQPKFEVKTETQVKNGQLHSDGAADGASNHEWHWNNENSWNQWTTNERSNGNIGDGNGNGNQINQQISTWSAWNANNVMMEDDDDETWGKWKPDGLKEHKEPVPEPKEPPAPKEPDVKRPRTESQQPQQPQQPLTPPGDQAPPSAWKRMESTRQAGVFYYFNTTTMQTQVEPPPPWEKKQSRRDPSILYYWNPVTNQTSLEKPLI